MGSALIRSTMDIGLMLWMVKEKELLRGPSSPKSLHRSFPNHRILEATAGIEPANGGFADPCLTTWLRRLAGRKTAPPAFRPKWLAIGKRRFDQSGRWDSNPRPSPWQGDILPLNYTRLMRGKDTLKIGESQASDSYSQRLQLDSRRKILYPDYRPTVRSVCQYPGMSRVKRQRGKPQQGEYVHGTAT